MRPSLISRTIQISAFTVALALGGAAMALPQSNTAFVPVAKKKAAVVAVPAGAVRTPMHGTPAAVSLIDQAYGLLSHADHDYKGHRKHAMRDIEAAARELGSKLSGDGHGKEQQGTSDSQLHQAESLLQQAVGGLAGKPLRHIHDALKQLGIALSVK
jgi:hypothetical protein